ncbi:hypothetical protein PACTADRAFT_47512 [Pachysolen tannophilus NRRL Y-2460]|uniref:MARVEL domain-containing protein n=1 Tax=Pachysolen tannophilus NRRL Y-2460 TaxID=669874 RepID=A0A1E4U0W0_PACTA|nr:hypothetical protein PACTADRAFT_47512 [Pachysolen tannophilus NRRL Y-2460]
MALSIGDVVLRGINFAFLVIIIGLSGSLAATTISQHNPQVNYVIFAGAFGILFSSIYGLLAYFIEILAWPALLVTLDFLNTVFTFAGGCALAAAIRCHSCTNSSYLSSNKVAQGSTDRCRKAQATVAFLYFSFFVFLISLIFQIISLIKNGAFGFRTSTKRAPSTGVPTMTQV